MTAEFLHRHQPETRMKKILILITGIALTGQLSAQPVPDDPDNEHKLQIGLAAVTSESVYLGGSSQSRVFPAIDYTYKRFYFQAGDVGFHLLDDDHWEVNMGLGVNLVGDVDRGDSRLLEHLPELSYPVNAFVSARYTSPIGLFTIKHHQEINNKHNGYSNSLSYAAPIRQGQWLIMPQLSYEQHSAAVVNYFYGIAPEDATSQLPAYRSGSVNNWQISLLGLRTINQRWSFIGNIQHELYGDAISNSPLVNEDQRLSVFVGLLYKVF
jgi:outer membrane protein